MDDPQFTRLISEIETQSVSIKYDFEISSAFDKILESNKDKLNPEQKEALMWELLLFRLMTKNRFSSRGLKTERFKPMMTFTDGRIFPDPNGFPDKAVQYFEKRSKTAVNPIFKARYLDFLWEKLKNHEKHVFAQEAVEQYLLTTDDGYYSEEAISERLDGLQRAAELALILEGKSKNKLLSRKVVNELNQKIEKTAQAGNYRWLIELFDLVLAFPAFYNDDKVKEYIRFAEIATKHFHDAQNFLIQRHFIQLKAELAKLIKKTQKIEGSAKDEIGQSMLDEAAGAKQGLVKVHYLQQAIEYFSNLGDKKKVAELTAQLKKEGEWAVKNEFKQFSFTVELKKEDKDRILASLGEGVNVPENMGIIPTFIPRWEHAVKLTEDLSKKYVFQHLVGTVHYGDKYPVGKPKTKEQEQEDHVMQNFQLEVGLANRWLTACLQELIRNKKVSATDFQKSFEKLRKIDPDTYESVMEGVTSFFKGDHFQAVYVLTLQLEDFLRNILTVFGGQTTVLSESGGFREKTLGSVLDALNPYIGESAFRYISWVMDDYRGFNLRNRIAHGLFKKKNANPTYSTAVLHIFCYLMVRLQLKDDAKR